MSGAGVTNAVTCASRLETAAIGQWVCEHRDPVIVRMMAFRRSVAGSDINRLWDNGGNAVAFSRGDQGFVAINRESSLLGATIATGLAAGTYCDMLTGGKVGAVCAGTRVTVGATGAAVVTLAANSAVVLLGGVRE